MGAWVWLALAIGAEVTGTVSLKFADGFSRPLPTALVLVGYGVAFFALSRVLKAGMPIGLVYALWAALGVAAIAMIGWLALGEQMNWVIAGGLVLVIGGVVMLEVGQAQ